jgi:hypothetical protein
MKTRHWRIGARFQHPDQQSALARIPSTGCTRCVIVSDDLVCGAATSTSTGDLSHGVSASRLDFFSKRSPRTAGSGVAVASMLRMRVIVGDEAHVEHAVGFVEDQRLHRSSS